MALGQNWSAARILFPDLVRQLFEEAIRVARDYSHKTLGIEHVLLALDFERFGVSPIAMRSLVAHDALVREVMNRYTTLLNSTLTILTVSQSVFSFQYELLTSVEPGRPLDSGDVLLKVFETPEGFNLLTKVGKTDDLGKVRIVINAARQQS